MKMWFRKKRVTMGLAWSFAQKLKIKMREEGAHECYPIVLFYFAEALYALMSYLMQLFYFFFLLCAHTIPFLNRRKEKKGN